MFLYASNSPLYSLPKIASRNPNYHTDKFVEGLKLKESSELERELAQYYFDILFIQTQMEASQADGEDSESMRQIGEKRLLRLNGKVEATKRELFGRNGIASLVPDREK
jgi:hypothetical protein